MKNFGNPLLSLAAPCLILVAIMGLLQRQGSDRLQSLPALLVGIVLVISGALERRNHRKKLLLAIRHRNQGMN